MKTLLKIKTFVDDGLKIKMNKSITIEKTQHATKHIVHTKLCEVDATVSSREMLFEM